MRVLILPAVDLADELKLRLESWFNQQAFPEKIETDVTVNGCREIVEAIIYEVIDHRMRWIRHKKEYVQEKMCALFPVLTHNSDRFDAAYTDVIDHYEMQIQEMIDGFVPCNTWRIFHLKRIYRDIVIERGEDYRLVDWQRKFDNGEIRLGE